MVSPLPVHSQNPTEHQQESVQIKCVLFCPSPVLAFRAGLGEGVGSGGFQPSSRDLGNDSWAVAKKFGDKPKMTIGTLNCSVSFRDSWGLEELLSQGSENAAFP